MMFLDCPAYLDEQGAIRCGLPAEVSCRFTMRSTGGPLECAMIRCPAGHWFNGPIGSLTCNGTDSRAAGGAAADASPRHDSLKGSDAARDGRGGGLAFRVFPRKFEREVALPNGAPAYYLGQPARLWITAMNPRRTRQPQAGAPTQTGGRDQLPNAAHNVQHEPTRVLSTAPPA
jgi:hypothetical protein